MIKMFFRRLATLGFLLIGGAFFLHTPVQFFIWYFGLGIGFVANQFIIAYESSKKE